MRKITLVPDDSLMADYPRVWPADVTVTTVSGTHAKRVDFVPGDPSRPFSAEDVKAKFRRFVTPILGADETESMLHLALALSPKPLFDALKQLSGIAFTSAAAGSRPH